MAINIQPKAPTTASKFFDAVADFAFELACRWQEEHEYEDINEYKTALQSEASKHNVLIEKMITKPFGFFFRTELGTYKAVFKMNGRCEMERVR